MAFKKTFIISDESVNSYGFSIVTAGIVLDNAKRNCPAFYDHRTWETPIGHWENLRIENNNLLGDLIIEGADDREKEYIRKIENGDIKGASGGFDPITWTEDEKYMKKGQTAPTLSESELFEASITPLPGNTNCLALKKENSLVVLSDGKHNSIIPSLTKQSDMKKIALTLGLKDDATEAEIIAAIGTLQLSSANAETMRVHIESQANEQLNSEPHKRLFAELSKSNFTQALAFLALNKAAPDHEAPPAPGDHSKVMKDVKITDLLVKGKQQLKRGQDDESIYCFDYFQRKNPAELKRIKSEDPDRYNALLADYKSGVRYNP